MRVLFSAFCFSAISLISTLQAQSEKIDLGFKFETGVSYQLKIQQEYSYEKPPPLIDEDRKDLRSTPDYLQTTRTYELTVLDQKESNYRIKLVRTFLQTCTHFDRGSDLISDYTSSGDPAAAARFRDTVNLVINRYGEVTQMNLPDSTARGYLVPDSFKIEMEPVMPELVTQLSSFLNFIPQKPVSIGDTWTNTSGDEYTLLGKRNDLWHLRSRDGWNIYLDPKTRWVKFAEQHPIITNRQKSQLSSSKTQTTFIQGKIGRATEPVRISGYAPKHSNGKLLLRITPYFMGMDREYSIPVNAAGYFEWQALQEHSFFFQLTDLYQNTFWGFAEPETSLQLEWQAEGTWTATGNNREACHYLNDFFKTHPKYEPFLQFADGRSLRNIYNEDLEQFWKDCAREEASALHTLTDLTDRLSPEFVALQRRQIRYLRASALNLNLSIHLVRMSRTFPDSGSLQTIPPYYTSYLDKLALYNEVNRSIPAFRALLHLNLQRQLYGSTRGDLNRTLSRGHESTYYFAQLHYQHYALYQTTYDQLRFSMNRIGTSSPIDHLYRHFQERFPQREYTADLATRYRAVEHLQAAGEQLPEVMVFNEHGDPVKLRGKSGTPTVLILVQGHNYWAQILEIENTAKLFPDLQFVFLHIGQAAQGQSDLPELDNIRQLYARTNSGAVARAFMQYAPGRHPRVYLINRKGKLAGTLLASEHYSEGILKALAQLRQGEPVFDQQTQKSIFLILAGILGGGLIIGFIIHQWQQRLRRREQFERQRISAQLQAIRSQLNPHFMFNSMSSIQHLIRSGQAGLAQSYLGKLAELLRATLRYTRENFISLQEELDVVGQYCELEALRFNFSFDLQVEETLNTRAISIPPLLLQPYVENAVLHGIAPLQEGGRLKMEIREQGRRLWIRIRDNGQGIKAVHTGSKKGNGIGLKLNAERLRLVYGNDAQVNVYSPSPANGKDLGMGTEVQIAVPIDV